MSTVRRITTEEIRLLNPNIREFWNVRRTVEEAGKRGLSITPNTIAAALMAGRGPKIYATSGRAVLIRPEDGERWIKKELERRRREWSFNVQRMHGIAEANVASFG
jgi:hypothetical protein